MLEIARHIDADFLCKNFFIDIPFEISLKISYPYI